MSTKNYDRTTFLRLDERQEKMLEGLRKKKQEREKSRTVSKSEVLRELIEKAYAVS